MTRGRPAYRRERNRCRKIALPSLLCRDAVPTSTFALVFVALVSALKELIRVQSARDTGSDRHENCATRRASP